MRMSVHHTFLNNLKTYAFASREVLLDYIEDKKGILIAINAEKIIKTGAQIQPIINDNIGYADGIGAVWALRKKGARKSVRIPGCELWLDLIRRFEKEKSFYLVGGTQEVIEATVQKLKQEYPAINILAYRNGFLKDDTEKAALLASIKTAEPDIVFVAMGTPRQELLMHEMSQQHPAIYQGLGGSFDVYTGSNRRAPVLFRKTGLEWLYRLLKQPWRATRQIHLVKFFWLTLLNRL